jgi:uncharacterized protein YukE
MTEKQPAMANNDNTVSVDPEAVHAQAATLVERAESLRTSNQGFVNGLGAASPGWIGASGRALDTLISYGTQQNSRLHNRMHGTAQGMRNVAYELTDQDDRNRGDLARVQAVDYRPGIPQSPPPGPEPGQPGMPSDPTYPHVGDPSFGQWETVPPPPPYVGASPPPLKPQYRPLPDGTPLTVGPSTGMFTPGKTWIGDIDEPAAQFDTSYRFRWAGDEATTVTRVASDGSLQRWVARVYEYQRNTDFHLNGDLGALPHIINFDRTWHPITLQQLAQLSYNNPDVTFSLPDGCGGTIPYVNGAAQRFESSVPIMLPGK